VRRPDGTQAWEPAEEGRSGARQGRGRRRHCRACGLGGRNLSVLVILLVRGMGVGIRFCDVSVASVFVVQAR
jgi:hypothetical protein